MIGTEVFQRKKDNLFDTIYLENSPILESIYQLIANEFSKLDFFCYQEKEIDGEIVYDELKNSPLNDVLQLRANAHLSAHDYKFIVIYQLVKYGTAIVILHRNNRGEVIALEPLNVDQYYFGRGYETDENRLFLKVKDKKSGDISLINYDDCLHLRLNANDIFNGEKSSVDDCFEITKIIDMQLNTLFNEMAQNGAIKGTLKLTVGTIGGSGLNSANFDEETKRKKQQIISERLALAESQGVMVLDDGEEWKSFDNTYKKLDSTQLDNLFKYLYSFKGINEKVVNGTATCSEMEIFFNKTIRPLVEQLVDECNYKMLTPTARTQGKKIDYRRNPFEYVPISEASDYAYKTGMYAKINEMRKWLFKAPPIKGGDVLLENLNFKKGEEDSEVKENE